MVATTANRPTVPGWAWFTAAAGVAATLVFDLVTPLGTASGAPYVILILLGLWTRSRSFVIGLTGLTLVLVPVGMLLSPAGLGPSIYLTNRALVVFAIIVCAFLVLYQQHLSTRIQLAYSSLDASRQQLFASEQTMQAVVENAVEGIINIDTRGTILSANRAAREIFNYEESEMIGQNVSVLMPSPDREQHDGYIKRYVETGVAGTIGKGREVVALRKGGQRFPIYLSVSDIREAAGLFTGVVRDLTEEKRLQKQLQEQEALATIGRMAAVVAHEVRNPLAGIAGVIQVLRQRMPEASDERQVMGEVLARIDSLAETLKDLLLYAQPRELRLVRTSLNELLRETARLLANDENARDIIVAVPDGDCHAEIDVDYVREAMLNIFLNAAQAMGGRGDIRTEVDDVGKHWRVRIIDSGPGIPEEARERLFEPFFTTKGRGTGLGLPLVRRVIERHSGRVDIECPAGGGTIVTLTLPRSTEAGRAS